jgi:thiol-disulfide isomerase/thioredoxin
MNEPIPPEPPQLSRAQRLRAYFSDRQRWKRWAIELLIVVAIVAGVQLWQARGLAEGVAPPLAGSLSDGRGASLAGTLEAAGGRPVLVVFWATWCPVCKAEEGNIDAVARDWPTLTVAMQSEGAANIAKHLRERGLGFAAIVDDDARLAADWKVRGVPTHFIVDSAGNIRFRLVGYTTEPGLRARLWWAQKFPA